MMASGFRESCLVCGSAEHHMLYRPERSPGMIFRCQCCGFIFVKTIENDKAIIDDGNPFHVSAELLNSRNVNDLVGCWEVAHLPGKLAEAPALRLNALDALNRIACFRSPPGRLLDFGCGWGFFLAAAREVGWSIFGLEPLPGHAIYARGHFGAEVVSDILRDSSYPPEFFDIVTAFQVFEHLPDPAGDVARLAKCLKPGGLALIEVPNIDTWSVRLLGKKHRHFVHDHLNFFSPQTLSRLLENGGFDVVDIYHPSRRMTYRHLMTIWGRRYLPPAIGARLSDAMRKTHLWDRTMKLNLGDIVAVIGLKPGQ